MDERVDGRMDGRMDGWMDGSEVRDEAVKLSMDLKMIGLRE